MTIWIPLRNSDSLAVVDDDFAYAAQWRWHLDKAGYVRRRSTVGRGDRCAVDMYLHKLVLPGNRYPAFVRDHIDRDKLNNTTANLRWLTPAESVQNRGVASRNATGYRGVLERTNGGYRNRFRAIVYLNRKAYRLGHFATPEEANAVLVAWRLEHMPLAGDTNASASA